MTMYGKPAGVRADPRLPGLERRTLGPVQVFAQSVSATAPAAGMATTPAIVAATAGGSAGVWACVIATVVALLVAGCIGQFTRRMAAAGSLYSLAAKGLGPTGAFAAACALLAGYALLVAATLTGAAVHLGALLRHLAPSAGGVGGSGGLVAVVVLMLGGAVGGCAWRGVRLSARVALLVEGVSIALILTVFALLVNGVSWHGVAAHTVRPPGDAGAVAAAVVPALGSFVGFEAATALGVEARRPYRSVPRAVTWTAALTGVMYVGAAVAQSGLGDGGRTPAAAAASAPPAWIMPLLDAGLAASFLACALATANALVRVLYSLGTEGIAPAVLRRTHPVHRTPHLAVLLALPVTTAPPLLMLACGVPAERVLSGLLQAATVGYLVAYLLICLAVPSFLRGLGELTVPPVATALAVVPVLAAVLCAFTVSRATPAAVAVFAVLVAAALTWYVWLRRRLPERLAGIGVYDETSLADLPDTAAVPVAVPGGWR